MNISNDIRVNLSDIIGKGYNEFWHCKRRYRVIKGGRGSKKSTTEALWIIYNMMRMPLANVLVLRQFFINHKDSTYAQLKWATRRLKVSHLWDFKLSPMEIIYRPTGQKILFRGLDKPESITSITVDIGVLCWVWVEEAYQVKDEQAFNMVDMSIRGELPKGYFKQFTLTFNPWNDKIWLKKRFFDNPDERTFCRTTTYECNEFLDADDIKQFDLLSPRRKKVEADGDWGIAEGLVYENWTVQDFDVDFIRKLNGAISCFGLDFGYTVDPTGFICAIVILDKREIYIFDEIYKKGLSNRQIYEIIRYKGYSKESIVADSAEPKSIDELKRYGLLRIKPAAKGRDSVMHGVQQIQDYKIIVHPSCKNTETELNNYCFKADKAGGYINEPEGDYNHLMDALRYAVEDKLQGKQQGRIILGGKRVF